MLAPEAPPADRVDGHQVEIESRGCVTRYLGWFAVLGLSLLAIRVEAAEKPLRVAVLDVKTSGGLDADVVLGLSNLVASEAARLPLRVSSGADLRTLLGLEKEKQLLGCSEGSCIAEIAGSLGVDYLLATSVAKVGEVWLFTFNLLDVKKARSLARITEQASDEKGLVALAPEGVARALQPIASAPASAGRVAGYVLDGTGAALLAGGAAFGAWSYLTFSQAKSAGSAAQMADLKSQTSTQMVVADVLYAAGAVALGVGLVLTFTSPSTRSSVTVGAAPTRGGGGLVVAGGF